MKNKFLYKFEIPLRFSIIIIIIFIIIIITQYKASKLNLEFISLNPITLFGSNTEILLISFITS